MSPWKRKNQIRGNSDPAVDDVDNSSESSHTSGSETRLTAHAALSAVTSNLRKPSPASLLTNETVAISAHRHSEPDDPRMKAKRDAEFAPLAHPSHLYLSQHPGGEIADPIVDDPPYFFLLTTYISFLILIGFGHVRDFLARWFRAHSSQYLRHHDGYAPLYSDFDSFYTRRLKQRIDDCFSRPSTGVPGRNITLLDRTTEDNIHFRLTGTTTQTLNLSSYNYLGFAQSEGPCVDSAERSIRHSGISMSASCGDAATSQLHTEAEEQVARFVGKESAIIFSMGFVTNATMFPAIVEKGCLILSDEFNHASIRFGARLSGASIQAFSHNNMTDLESRLRDAISQGQPRTHRPWKKILVTVEGLYSMEGTMVNLPRLLALKKRYKFYLYIDEAHSIGAVGPRGRGVCDFFKVDPAEVDILMGTFTKSFGANGGYVAADKAIINKLRHTNAGQLFGEAPTPPVLAQILSSLRLIADKDPLHPGEGKERLQRLAFNSRYVRLGLKRLGFIVYGHDDSPIIPLMLYNPAKMPAFSHEMLRRKISVVVVTYPATPLELSRVRLCVSAAHNKDDLDRLLRACDEVGEALQLKFSSGIAGGLREPLPSGIDSSTKRANPPRWRYEEVIQRTTRDVKLPMY